MNKVILMGRLTRDPDVRTSSSNDQLKIARYSLAVDRAKRSEDNSEGQQADFPSCVALGKSAEFAEKYLHKGTKILVEGRLQTGSYQNKDGVTVYTTDVLVERHEFCESKGSGDRAAADEAFIANAGGDEGFINIPDGIDEELPFG